MGVFSKPSFYLKSYNFQKSRQKLKLNHVCWMETRSLWMYGWLWNMLMWSILQPVPGLLKCWGFEQVWNTLLPWLFDYAMHSLALVAWRGSWKVWNWRKHHGWCWSSTLLPILRQLSDSSRNQGPWRCFIKCASFTDIASGAMELGVHRLHVHPSVFNESPKNFPSNLIFTRSLYSRAPP